MLFLACFQSHIYETDIIHAEAFLLIVNSLWSNLAISDGVWSLRITQNLMQLSHMLLKKNLT